MLGVSDRISAAAVAKVAKLARLDVTEEELDRMTVQLDGMLEHFADIDAKFDAIVERYEAILDGRQSCCAQPLRNICNSDGDAARNIIRGPWISPPASEITEARDASPHFMRRELHGRQDV
jgi:Asp-tRNA(Asn)/Glu-tRNA(Gln) amidotransferase C subunit